MDVSIKYEENGGYLVISGEGEFNSKVILKFAHQVLGALNEHNCHKILEDYRKVGIKKKTFEIMYAQQFLDDFIKLTQKSPVELKRAVLMNEDASAIEDSSFFETMKVSRGNTIKLFTDLDKAINWLTEE